MTQDLQTAQPLPSDFSDRVFTLNLALAEPKQVTVRSCEVIGRTFRNRTSFPDNNDIDAVLDPHLAERIRQCLEKVPAGGHVLSLPELLIEVPGLVLYGVHIMVMEVKDGIRSAIFRFKEFMGSITRAFRLHIGIEEQGTNYNERLATNVLSDICLPILNLAREMEFAHRDAGTKVPKALENRAREFEFQTELLKRFIFNAGLRGDPAASQLPPRTAHHLPGYDR